MRAFARLVPFVLVGALFAPLWQSADATPTGSLPGFCDLASPANRWTGATSSDWETDSNWSTGSAPGHAAELGVVQDACIDAGKPHDPVIGDGTEEHLRTLDVQSGATLRVDQGGKLFLYGSQSGNEDSVVRTGATLDVTAGTLGGIARLHVLGTLFLRNSNDFASTLLTRECAYFPLATNPYPGEDTCLTSTSSPRFFLEVDDKGLVDVRGGGVNIGDQTRIVDRGTIAVRAGAYLAADHGTRLELRPHRTSAAGTGTLRFEGNGGYLEGKIESDTGIAAQSTLVNQGLIAKTGGTGRTLVSAVYSQPAPGAVRVARSGQPDVPVGTLLLPRSFDEPAFVAAGSTYGTGHCTQADNPSCTLQTTGDTKDTQQAADLRVPNADTTGARVEVRRLGARSTSSDLGYPFEVHATSLNASATKPAIIRLRIDATVAKGKGWRKVTVHRKSGTAPYRLVKACTSTGKPPTGEVACVDRRGIRGVSSHNISNGNGTYDVVMVVRTTKTSRWVGR